MLNLNVSLKRNMVSKSVPTNPLIVNQNDLSPKHHLQMSPLKLNENNNNKKSYLDLPTVITTLNITIMSHLETGKYEIVKYHRRVLSKVKRILFICLLMIFALNFHLLVFVKIQNELNMNTFQQFNLSSFTNINQTSLIFINTNTHGKLVPNIKCGALKNSFYSYFLDKIWVFIDFFVYFLIPALVKLVCFSFVCVKMNNANKKYAHLISNKSYKSNRRIYKKKIKRNKAIVKRLLINYLYFVMTILPYFLFNIFLSNNRQQTSLKNYGFIEIVLLILFYSNNSMNFFFYGIACKSFRQELLRILEKMFCFLQK